MTSEIEILSAAILSARQRMPTSNALLVGISGIDASGKGFVSQQVARDLELSGVRVALINADGWLNLPSVRFNPADEARHFYDNALRLDAMFEQLVLPLRAARSIEFTADLVEETAAAYHKHLYRFTDIDIILIEGIYLFKKRLREHFDLRIWLECSFETALSRAVARGQEGLGREATIKAYETIYFPAQRLHFAIDGPRHCADIIFPNS